MLYSRGDLFHSNGAGRNSFRLTYSAASLPEIEAGVEILGTLVKERLDRAQPPGRESMEAVPSF